MPKVSIIVPVYNAGKYFERRLESLVNQTLKEIEIILVLDCPTDGSERIADRYALSDNRVQLVHNQTNQHIGNSRNIGMRRASGKYIAFADHDDYCEENMYETLYQLAEQNGADMVFSDMYIEEDNGNRHVKQYFQNNDIEIKKEVLSELLKGNGFYYSVLNHLYRRTFLNSYQIEFVDTRKISLEDRCFNMYAYYCTDKIVYSSEKHLYHVLYAGSTQHSYNFKCLPPTIGHLEYMALFFENHPEYREIYESEFSRDVVRKLYYGFLPEVRHKSIFHAFKTLGSIKKSRLIQRSLRNFKKQQVPIPLAINFFFFLLEYFYITKE